MKKIVLTIIIPPCCMNHEIISLLSTLGLRDEIVQINKMMKLIKFVEAKKNANISKYTRP